MDKKIIILIIAILIIVVGIGSYFAYDYYNETQTKNHMVLSKEYSDKGLANDPIKSKAYEQKNYTKYLELCDNSSAYFFLAIEEDRAALKTDDGTYKEYINYDIDRLKKDMEIMASQKSLIYAIQRNNLGATIKLVNDIDDLSDDANDFKDKQTEIINTNPELYEFLTKK